MKSFITDMLVRAGIHQTSCQSGGRKITLEYKLPGGSGPHPAVLLLHGSNGAHSSRSYFHFIMQGLARLGYASLFPHYFDRTGDGDIGAGEQRDELIGRSFLLWQETIQDAIAATHGLRGIDTARIALLGVSLGSYLALGVAANGASAVCCVIEFCGGIPENLQGRLETMPPVLILHGEADTVVPVTEAYELDRALSEKNLPHQIHIYPGQGHIFTGAAEKDAVDRCRSFLQTHLSAR